MNQLDRSRHLFYGWRIVAASVVGAAFSPATLVNVPFGLFIHEFESEFQWTRSQVTTALSVFITVLAIVLPLTGRLIDRLGARRVAIPSIALYGGALASMALLTNSLLHFYAGYAAIALVGAGAQSLTYIKVLSEWFDRRRGLVIGICMSGYGIGYVVVPIITRKLIDAYGWRGAYVGLGLLAIAAPLPAVIAIMRDRPRDMGLNPDGASDYAAPAAARTGKTIAQALKMREMWMLAASFVLASFALNGAQSQIVPLLQGRGMPPFRAALMLSAIGFGSFPGRLLVGYLVDKIFAPYVTVAFYAASAVGLFFLIAAIPDGAVMLCAIAIGLSLGAENDVLGFLTSRYFGLKHFGQIYCVLFCAYLLGAAAGPYTMARAYVLTGSYRSGLMAGIGAILLSSTLLLLLRKWPETPDSA